MIGGALSTLLFLFSIAGPIAAAGPPAETPAGGRLGGGLGRIAALVKAHGPFDPSVREHIERLARFNQVDLDSAPPWVQVHLLFDREDLNPLRAAGGKIHGRMGEVVSVRVPVDALAALARVPGVLSVQPARRYNLHMDISRPEMGAEAVTDQFALTGAGTLVAVVDTGIDWTHRDFRNPDKTTRIAAIWDQTDSSGLPPSGFGSGATRAPSSRGAPQCQHSPNCAWTASPQPGQTQAEGVASAPRFSRYSMSSARPRSTSSSWTT